MPSKNAKSPYPTPRIPARPVPLADAASVIKQAWTAQDLWPEPTRADALARAHALAVAASRAGVTAMDELVGEVARHCVAAVAGVPKLGATLSDAQRADVRPVRNTLLAMHATVALAVPGTDEDDTDDPYAELPNAAFPRKIGHACRTPRPWHDDEIALARIHFLGLTHLRSLRVGNAYALLEAGAYPGDAAAALSDHLDDPDNPTTIEVAARAHRGDRRLELTAFGAQLLARNLRLMREADLPALERLTFTGAKPASPQACMSVQGALNDHLAWAGVEDAHTNVSGVSAWRHRQLVNAVGLKAGLANAYGDRGHFTSGQYEHRERSFLRGLHTTIADLVDGGRA